MAGGCSNISSNMGCSSAKNVNSKTTESTKSTERSNRKVCHKGGAKTEETCVDDHLSKRFQHSVNISGSSDRSSPVLSLKETTKLSSMPSMTKVWREKTPNISSTSRASKRISAQKQEDKPTQAQQTKPTKKKSDNSEKNQVQNSSSHKSSTQSTKRNSIPKASIPSDVPKTVKQKPTRVSQSKPPSKSVKNSFKDEERYSRSNTPIYHITLHGVRKVCDEKVERICSLCNEDLSVAVSDDEYKYYNEYEPSNFPDVAVLSCGHVFHSECLVNVTPEEQARDPPCFLCLSLMS